MLRARRITGDGKHGKKGEAVGWIKERSRRGKVFVEEMNAKMVALEMEPEMVAPEMEPEPESK